MLRISKGISYNKVSLASIAIDSIVVLGILPNA